MEQFALISASEVLAASTLAGYLWSGYRIMFPLSPVWVTGLVALLTSQISSFLIMLMEGHELTTGHLAGHVVIGILAAATITGLRQVHSFSSGKVEVAETARAIRQDRMNGGSG